MTVGVKLLGMYKGYFARQFCSCSFILFMSHFHYEIWKINRTKCSIVFVTGPSLLFPII